MDRGGRICERDNKLALRGALVPARRTTAPIRAHHAGHARRISHWRHDRPFTCIRTHHRHLANSLSPPPPTIPSPSPFPCPLSSSSARLTHPLLLCFSTEPLFPRAHTHLFSFLLQMISLEFPRNMADFILPTYIRIYLPAYIHRYFSIASNSVMPFFFDHAVLIALLQSL